MRDLWGVGMAKNVKKKTARELIGGMTASQRIDLAKAKMKRILDHLLYVIEINANNEIVLYSNKLSSQIPASYAANAFNVFQRSMHQIELVRVCALWDGVDLDKENIPTAAALIDDSAVIEMLAEETRAHHVDIPTVRFGKKHGPRVEAQIEAAIRKSNLEFGESQAKRVRTDLRGAISATDQMMKSDLWQSVMNVRDKHVAHSLEATRREKRAAITPMKNHDGIRMIEASIPIVEPLYTWITGSGFSIEESRRIDRKNAAALWDGCKFEIER